MTVPFRPLGMIAELLEDMALEVTYAFDDLIFVSHNAFLLQMGNVGKDVSLFFNEESDPAERGDIAQEVCDLGTERGLTIQDKGTFVMTPNKNDTLNIEFKPYESV